METGRHKRKSLGQNFLRSPQLVRELVRLSSIGPEDVAVEIGPGRGIITAELARRAKKVVAIEKDAALVRRLRDRFKRDENVNIIEADILNYRIAVSDYKLFASVPYNITAAIVRKVLFDDRNLREAHLILQREAARKFSGVPRETMFSILAKPFYEFEIVRCLRRTDFEPIPDVDSVMLRIARRRNPLIRPDEAAAYHHFARIGFGSWKRNLRSAFKRSIGYKQWKRMSRELHFSLDATPTQLTFEQWYGLFRSYTRSRTND